LESPLVRRYLAIKKRVKADPAKTHGAPVPPEPMREIVAA